MKAVGRGFLILACYDFLDFGGCDLITTLRLQASGVCVDLSSVVTPWAWRK